jgi:VWFA-related protein
VNETLIFNLSRYQNHTFFVCFQSFMLCTGISRTKYNCITEDLCRSARIAAFYGGRATRIDSKAVYDIIRIKKKFNKYERKRYAFAVFHCHCLASFMLIMACTAGLVIRNSIKGNNDGPVIRDHDGGERSMGIHIFKRTCVAFSLLMLLACSGGGGGGGSAQPPAATPAIYLAQSSYDFSGIVLDNSADKTFEIKNTGNANLKIGQIVQPGLLFSISSDTCSHATLTPSQTCSLGIRFSPTSQGPSSATLSIPSNDPHSSTVNISLSGEGYGLNVWINKVDSASCPSISADVTITDPRSSSLLTSLTTDNFKLYQNDQLQTITATGIQYPSPVSLVLALDSSISTVNVMPAIRAAANSFINQLSNQDWAAICKFHSVVEFNPSTAPLFVAGDAAGKTVLNAYINTPFAGSGTALYDAVIQSIDRAAQGTTDKRAVIILSDGADDASVKTLDQVIANAAQKGIPVFAIFYVDPNLADYAKPEIMQRLAGETGGQYYNSAAADLASIFQQISNVLSNKYTLNYTSSTCSETISLDVRTDWNGLYGQDPRTVTLP